MNGWMDESWKTVIIQIIVTIMIMTMIINWEKCQIMPRESSKISRNVTKNYVKISIYDALRVYIYSVNKYLIPISSDILESNLWQTERSSHRNRRHVNCE